MNWSSDGHGHGVEFDYICSAEFIVLFDLELSGQRAHYLWMVIAIKVYKRW